MMKLSHNLKLANPLFGKRSFSTFDLAKKQALISNSPWRLDNTDDTLL